MDTLLETFSLLLLISLVLGLLRVWKGPGFADRMLAAQLLGTTGVAMLVLLADPLGLAALRDVALVLALLAVLAVLAFVARVWDPDEQVPDGSENPSDTRTEAAPAQQQRAAGTAGRRRG